MLPKLILMPTASMTTCAKNKDTHPGYVDLPDKPVEMAKPHQWNSEEEAREAAQCTEAGKKAAELQDKLRRQDKAREELRRDERAARIAAKAEGT